MHQVSELVDSCSPWDGYRFDPGTHVRAVNRLCAEQKAEVIGALRDYAQSTVENRDPIVGNTRLVFLLRLLFEPFEGSVHPGIVMGKPVDVEDPPVHDYPLYPLVLLEDVPFLIVPGFILGGVPGDPMTHVEFCEQHCRIREQPLRPPDNPLRLAESLLASPKWYRVDVEHDRGVLRAQLLRLVRAVYAVPWVDEPDAFSSLTSNDVWEEHVKSYSALQVVWDETKNDYRH